MQRSYGSARGVIAEFRLREFVRRNVRPLAEQFFDSLLEPDDIGVGNSTFRDGVFFRRLVFGPFLVGLVHEATGGWTLILVLLALTSVPLTIAGVRVARPTYVDDEI